MIMLVVNVLTHIGDSLNGRGCLLSTALLDVSVFLLHICLLKGLFDACLNEILSSIHIADVLIKMRLFPDF
jgi:hypothetical protein